MSIAKTPHIQTPASDPDPAAVPAGRLPHRDVRKMKIHFTLCAYLTCREEYGAGTGRL